MPNRSVRYTVTQGRFARSILRRAADEAARQGNVFAHTAIAWRLLVDAAHVADKADRKARKAVR